MDPLLDLSARPGYLGLGNMFQRKGSEVGGVGEALGFSRV